LYYGESGEKTGLGELDSYGGRNSSGDGSTNHLWKAIAPTGPSLVQPAMGRRATGTSRMAVGGGRIDFGLRHNFGNLFQKRSIV